MARVGQAQKTIPRPDRSQQADRLTNPVRIGISGDGSSETYQFDGSQSLDINFTLADVNGDVGTFGDATNAVIITVNAKGLVTAIEEVPIAGAGPSAGNWSPLTNGDPINPELIFTADGDTIAVWTPA